MTIKPCPVGAFIMREGRRVETCYESGRPLDSEGICIAHFSTAVLPEPDPFARREAAAHLRLGRHFRDRGDQMQASDHFLSASHYYRVCDDEAMEQLCMTAYAAAYAHLRPSALVNVSALVD